MLVFISCLVSVHCGPQHIDIEVLFLPMHVTSDFVVLYNVTTLASFYFPVMIGSVDLVWT